MPEMKSQATSPTEVKQPPATVGEVAAMMAAPAPTKVGPSNADAEAQRENLPNKVGISTCHGGEMVHPFYGDGSLRFSGEAILVPRDAVDAWLMSQVEAGKLRIES